MGKNKTIYFRTHIADRLDGVAEPGPLINDLLEAHFNTTPKPTQEQVNAVANMDNDKNLAEARMPARDASSKPSGISGAQYDSYEKNTAEQAAPAGTEKPCCNKSAPCQHWQWDGVNEVWKNSLSGRTRSND